MEKMINSLRNLAGDKYQFEVVSDVKVNNVCVSGVRVAGSDVGFVFRATPQDNNESPEERARKIINYVEDELEHKASMAAVWKQKLLSWDYVKEHIVSCICQKSNSGEFLKDKAYYDFMDLAVYFRILMDCDGRQWSVPVTERLCLLWKVGLEDVKMAARRNWSDEKIKISMNFMDFCLADYFKNSAQKDGNSIMWLEYEGNQYGGSILEREDILCRIAERTVSDLIVLPSRKDVTIVWKAITESDYQFWTEAVKSGNKLLYNEEPTAVLTDHAYIFSRKSGRVLEEGELRQYFSK